jgi:hypothetical protein
MTMKTESNRSRKTVIQSVGAILCASALGALFSGQAGAACMDPQSAAGQASLHQSPQIALNAPAARSTASQPGNAAQEIVGTWLVAYSAGGAVYGEAFIQWHSDGTEWENVDFPILGGNICLGSWTPVGGDQVSRLHVGWLYSNGILSGHFIETETDLLSRDGNSYTGNNDTKMYNLAGTMIGEVVGTSAATRISP